MERLVPALALLIGSTVACTSVPAAVPTDLPDRQGPPAVTPDAGPSASPALDTPAAHETATTVYALYGRPLGDHARQRIERLALGTGRTHDVGTIEIAQPLVASPDGARMLTVEHVRAQEERSDTVVVMRGRRLQHAVTIFEAREGSISGETWSRDGRWVFFVHAIPDDDEPSPTEYRVYRARATGGAPTTIATFRRQHIIGFAPGVQDMKGDLWFVEASEGGSTGMTRVDTTRGRAHHRTEPLAGHEGGSAVLSPDGTTLFYTEGRTVHAFDLATSSDRALYRLKPDRYVHRIVPMPDGSAVIILDVSGDGIGAKTRLVSTADGATRTLFKDLDPSYIGPSMVSADGSTIWFETWCFCGGSDERFGAYDVPSGRMRTLDLPAGEGIRLLAFLVV